LSANVTEQFLQKYDLDPNNVIRPSEKHRDLVPDMTANFKVDLIAGGAVQNSIRAAQWFFSKPRMTITLGAVGRDEFGELMRRRAEEEQVLVSYLVHDREPTGTCACLITDQGKNRSLVAYLGASQHFSLQYLKDNFHLVQQARIIYTSGFFITVCLESQLLLARHAHSSSGKLFAFNLSAPFIAHKCSSELNQILPYVDILFANQAEALALAESREWNVS